MQILSLANNFISDISELTSLKYLNNLILSGNSISDISSLSGFQYVNPLDDKWVALGMQQAEIYPVYYKKNVDGSIEIEVELINQLKDFDGSVPKIIKNFIYTNPVETIYMKSSFDDEKKTILFKGDGIPYYVSFSFNNESNALIADSFNGTITVYIAIYIENKILEDEIKAILKERGIEIDEEKPVLYKDYKAGEIENIESIDVSNMGLTNLNGIEYFTGLKYIKAEVNNLLSIASIFNMANIKNMIVDCRNQEIFFTDENLMLEKNYRFYLDRLIGKDEKNNEIFEVEVEIDTASINNGGTLSKDGKSIVWHKISYGKTVAFNYKKKYFYIENNLSNLTPAYNIEFMGATYINIKVEQVRGVDLF